MSRRTKFAAGMPAAGVALLLLMQLVPYGRNHSNPPVTGAPNWDSPQTEQLARRACYDCHSNETTWPWYASVAPISWRIQHHVNEARSKLNFSEFDRPQEDAHEAAEEVRDGEMPLWDYALMHPESRLSDSEKQLLIQGLKATLGGKDRNEDGDEDEREDDDD